MFPTPSITSALITFWTPASEPTAGPYVIGALLVASGLVHLAILVTSVIRVNPNDSPNVAGALSLPAAGLLVVSAVVRAPVDNGI